MTPLSPGQIHLADQRGLTENQFFRRYSTFNYGSYQHNHRRPFGNLQVLNDEWLAAAQSIEVEVEEACYVVVIPITGELACNNSIIIDAGQAYVCYAPAGTQFIFTNPYEADLINFLYLQIGADATPGTITALIDFDLEARPDELTAFVTAACPFFLHIGRFSGRREALYAVRNKQAAVYAFVIAGAFECQGRLLHERDGLALHQPGEVDLEALSNNAVILLIEM